MGQTKRAEDAALATLLRRSRLELSPAQHALAADIDQMVESRLGENAWWCYRETAVLPTLLTPGEKPIDVAKADYLFGGTGLLTLTEKRLLFVRYRLVAPSLTAKSFPLERIRFYGVINGRRGARLEFRNHGSARVREFHSMRLEDATHFQRNIEGLTELKAGVEGNTQTRGDRG